jgi:hypothetical protein
MVGQVKVVGILMMVNGVLVILMGVYCAAQWPVMMAVGGGPPPGGGGPPPWIFAVIYGAIGLVVIASGLLNVVAGFRVLSFRNRVLAIVALFSNIIPMFTCWCILNALGMMIYGLIVLLHTDVGRAFEMVSHGATPEEVIGQLTRRYGDVRDDYDEMYDSRSEWEEQRRRRRDEDEFDDDSERR